MLDLTTHVRSDRDLHVMRAHMTTSMALVLGCAMLAHTALAAPRPYAWPTCLTRGRHTVCHDVTCRPYLRPPCMRAPAVADSSGLTFRGTGPHPVPPACGARLLSRCDSVGIATRVTKKTSVPRLTHDGDGPAAPQSLLIFCPTYYNSKRTAQ